jgi:NADPH2:quinone reductase
MTGDMQAVIVEGDGAAPASLRLAAAPVPQPGEGEVLVRVRAAGVNRPDILQRRGLYPPPPGAPATLGLEVAGEVVALGFGISRWSVGDRVTALLGGGGYAEYAVVDARHALPIPAKMSWTEAASLPETVFTVWANVFDIARLQAGETLLVHGATSGIGVTAIQMAKAVGARVFATSRGAVKARQAGELGADLAIDSTAEVDLGLMMRKRLVLTGSTLRPRSADEKARLARDVEATVWPWLESGALRPVVDRVFPLAQAAEAHAWLEGGQAVGKVVLEP